MKMMKKVLSCLMAMIMLCSFVPVMAEEEEEELSFDDLLEEEEAEEFDSADWTITDEVQGTIEDLESWEVDTSVNPDDLEINSELPDHIVYILLIGIDTRSKTLDADAGLQHNDVNMILSINTETGSIKLTSILRDMYVSIPGYNNKSRINNAYARGGGQLAMRTINHNFDMNIQYYVTINFFGLASIIESIGGIDIEMTKGEAYAINHYIKEHPPVYDTKDGSERVPLEVVAGTQHLDGIQAVMYARLRTGMKTGNGDFNRTARQRKLLELLLAKIMQDMSLNKLSDLITTTLPYVTTNVNGGTIFNLAYSVLTSDIIARAQSGEELIQQHRVPMDKTYKYLDVDGSSVINLSSENWKTNINALHAFIYEQ
ncbi:MAG: LCP family protein [Clostridia bacterium]|nr:LCP family protein [Clostridia bacterium]MBR0463578.1 LCP family protein [Clostridia bacterium]